MLLQPPPGDLTGPYPALPYLKSFARAHGHTVRVRDLGIECLYFLTREDILRDILNRASDARKELESKKFLTPGEQSRYRRLVAAAWIGTKPDMPADTLKSFKEGGSFFNYRLYRQTCRSLDAFYGLLSALYYPTLITPSEYPTAQSLNSMANILAHRDPERNPYVRYYQEVLFPAVAAQAPKVVGISMEFASQSVQALVLGHLLKERFPDIHVTMGGAYLSQWAMLMEQEQLIDFFSCTDSVVCGEGEPAFPVLLKRIETGVSLVGVPNLLSRDPSTGEFCRPGTLEYPDIADLPAPDYSDLDLGAYLIPKPVIPYCVSRGCYWGKCVFCQNRYGENRMRRYQTVPVDKVIAEMSDLSEKYGTNQFNFSNDVLDPPYLKRLSEALLASNKKFLWNTDLRAEKAFTKELCITMARSGLNSVAIGFESGCQKTLDAMNKGKNIETVSQVLKDLYEAGVATQAMGIFGFPGETESEAAFTAAFLEKNMANISYYVIGLLMIVPGSRMHDEPQKYGVSYISYRGNTLLAPMPVWGSENRISPAAVNSLYHRVGHLEEFYAINEYPYVGALSTNHSFLYFETGPDVLKRVRKEELERNFKLLHILGIKDAHVRAKKLKSLAPRFVLPLVVYHSPFPVDQMNLNEQSNPNHLSLLSNGGWDCVVGPSDMVIQLVEVERRFLEAIDGRKNLRYLISKHEEAGLERLARLLLRLTSEGLIAM